MTLVIRMAASVANYDYIIDWIFQTDGLIRAQVCEKCIRLFFGFEHFFPLLPSALGSAFRVAHQSS